jgi:TM2 domain-containing membrane protein YozV
MSKSDKSYIVAVCLSGIFGYFGIQHFYLGRYIEGFITLPLVNL